MKLIRVYAVFLRQMYLIRHSIARKFGIFYWSTVELVMWGFLTVYLNRVGAAEFNFVTVLLGGLIFWEFFHKSQQQVSVSYMEDMWSRNTTNLFASPLTVGEYLAGLVLTSVSNTILTTLWVGALAWLLFAFNIFQYGFYLVPFVVLLYIFGWTFGILTSAIVLRFGNAGEIFAWSLPFLIQPFVAVFYPVSALPAFLQPISHALPLTYIFEGMRAIVTGGSFNGTTLLTAAALTIIYFILSLAFFYAIFRHARRKGYLVRFTTE